ncbi:hypothetical protein OROGR_025520 [Orobanche gracilis]
MARRASPGSDSFHMAASAKKHRSDDDLDFRRCDGSSLSFGSYLDGNYGRQTSRFAVRVDRKPRRSWQLGRGWFLGDLHWVDFDGSKGGSNRASGGDGGSWTLQLLVVIPVRKLDDRVMKTVGSSEAT